MQIIKIIIKAKICMVMIFKIYIWVNEFIFEFINEKHCNFEFRYNINIKPRYEFGY